FLRDTKDGRVYLMPRSMLSELQNAGHLIDRKLHTFDLPEFDRLTLSAGGKQKELVQLGREARATNAFALAQAPAKRDQMAKNWHDAMWRVFPTEVLGKGEEPSAGKPAVALRVDYFDGKKQVGWIEIGKVDVAAGLSEDTAGAAGDYYVRTE